jgi:N4-(beta-N-acetylglucosaminyl)-L-asparaginase
MINRRNFLISSIVVSAAVVTGFVPLPVKKKAEKDASITLNDIKEPIVISTWNHGIPANEKARQVLEKSGRVLDAVEEGVKVPEGDPKITSVGYGGLPDRDGHVTLDASIMDEFGNAGAVGCIEHIKHPISVARMVMEKTKHVMLVGDGALQFALENGFKKENLLTENAKRQWKKYLKENHYKPYDEKENHDTIGMIARDKKGNLSGACTTSGISFKLRGRVGDSPIIGAGLFVDNEVGGATSTGMGEYVMRSLGSFLIVELMRNGKSPQEACEMAVKRIVQKQKLEKDTDVAYIALNKHGEIGAYAIRKGFQYALYKDGKNQLIDSDWLIK